jgi:RHS repeat-associated protein
MLKKSISGMGCLYFFLFVCHGVAFPSPQTKTAYYLMDHLGSTRVVTDGSGAEQARYSYYPYGELLATHPNPLPRGERAKGEGDISYLFTGQLRDLESNLYYYGARYYDPSMGSFLSLDPIREYPSPYAYVAHNPLRYTDSTGKYIDVAIKESASFEASVEEMMGELARNSEMVQRIHQDPNFRVEITMEGFSTPNAAFVSKVNEAGASIILNSKSRDIYYYGLRFALFHEIYHIDFAKKYHIAVEDGSFKMFSNPQTFLVSALYDIFGPVVIEGPAIRSSLDFVEQEMNKENSEFDRKSLESFRREHQEYQQWAIRKTFDPVRIVGIPFMLGNSLALSTMFLAKDTYSWVKDAYNRFETFLQRDDNYGDT